MYIGLTKIERKLERIQNPHGLTMNNLQKSTPAYNSTFVNVKLFPPIHVRTPTYTLNCLTNDLLKLLNSCEFGQLYAHQSTAKIYKMRDATCNVRIYPMQSEDLKH
uniref:Uncharacterized protein n=1 Tax=Glossina pallidipes TaxID=7398 RepID=A0A1A9ZIP3_GLOPL